MTWILSRLPRIAPAAVAVGGCVVVLCRYGTPVTAMALYGTYFLLVITLPGTLLWRTIRNRRVSMAEDIAVGSAVGLALQALFGWMLAPLHLAEYSILWSPLVILATILIPRFRKAWQTTGEQNQTILSSWIMAAVVIIAAVWVGATSFSANQISQIPGMPGQFYAPDPYGDMMFHQSLAVGINSFYPLVYPYASTIPLSYQIFVYEHLANAAQVTGIDPTVLLMRLITLPLVAIVVVLTGTITHRISGRPGLAGWGSLLGTIATPLSVYPGNLGVVAIDSGTLNIGTFRSPTQTFGEPIFLALVTMACIAISSKKEYRRWPLYLAFSAAAFAAECSKATLLPILGAGIALGFCINLLIRRRVNGRLLILGTLTIAAQLASMVFVYGFRAHGLSAGIWQIVERSLGAQMLGPELTTKELVFLIIITIAAWTASAAGGVFLLVLRHRDVRTWLLLGIIIGGAAAALLFNQSGGSQQYFVRSAAPIFGVISALGFGALLDRFRMGTAGSLWLLIPSLISGGIVLISVHHLAPTLIAGQSYTAYQLAVPWIEVALGILVVGLLAVLAGRFLTGYRGSKLVLLGSAASCLAIVGACLTPVVATSAKAVLHYDEPVTYTTEGIAPIPVGGVEAARWLRDNSDPQDIVATNAHCYFDSCLPKHFYISAYSERRVLLEGWAYTTPDPDLTKDLQNPNDFWDPELLKENDIVFTNPTQENVQNLASKYGVKWLFVDRTVYPENPDLANYATLVYQNADAAIYRIDS